MFKNVGNVNIKRVLKKCTVAVPIFFFFHFTETFPDASTTVRGKYLRLIYSFLIKNVRYLDLNLYILAVLIKFHFRMNGVHGRQTHKQTKKKYLIVSILFLIIVK